LDADAVNLRDTAQALKSLNLGPEKLRVNGPRSALGVLGKKQHLGQTNGLPIVTALFAVVKAVRCGWTPSDADLKPIRELAASQHIQMGAAAKYTLKVVELREKDQKDRRTEFRRWSLLRENRGLIYRIHAIDFAFSDGEESRRLSTLTDRDAKGIVEDVQEYFRLCAEDSAKPELAGHYLRQGLKTRTGGSPMVLLARALDFEEAAVKAALQILEDGSIEANRKLYMALTVAQNTKLPSRKTLLRKVEKMLQSYGKEAGAPIRFLRERAKRTQYLVKHDLRCYAKFRNLFRWGFSITFENW